MEKEDMSFLKYPIGKFKYDSKADAVKLAQWITVLEYLPERLSQLVLDLDDAQLDTPYRPQGWTVRQLIHHIADSHHNSYTRFKWALTEDKPLIKVYEEKEWSALFDAKSAPIALSIEYLKALHAKLVYLLKGLSESDLQKFYIHPEGNVVVTVHENIAKYAWHSEHHFAHLANLLNRKGWA